ncbi:hypothetical protein [Pseudobdellovibrio sp. HCB154]|uniref:hypothetical protein n=1 Tax=Pseudobdellovibrio sp. HCB154 TaxID=3386277 RepID=UPI003916FDBF
MKIFITISALFIVASCAMPRPANQYDYRLQPTRAEYDLQKYGPLIFSNSPTSLTDCVQKIENGGVTLNVGWLIRNSSQEDVPLLIKDIKLILNDETTALKCFANNNAASDLTLKPQDKVVLSCQTNIYPTATNKLRSRDTKAIISIPFGKKISVVSSSVLLRIEDFE